MSAGEWFLWSSVVVLYLVCLFTVGFMTFRKGHVVLLIAGIFLPVLWIIGAFLPPKHA